LPKQSEHHPNRKKPFMIDLSQSQLPLVHAVPTDPGPSWVKDAAVAIEAPPDDDLNPLPEAQWSAQAVRSGVCGVVSPRVVALPGGGYRMYYSQILPRDGFPLGANDYENATTRILSATSSDGSVWTPEPGVRLSAHDGGAGDYRVVSCEVVPVPDAPGQLRMYYECSTGAISKPNSIRSAVSRDGGLAWTAEPGARLEVRGCNFVAPRIVFLEGNRCRLYCCERGRGIISALSEDGGVTFRQEPGLRIAQTGVYDREVAFACDIMRVEGAGYVMYYAGYASPSRAYILRAVSDDGLRWEKHSEPVIAPDGGVWDAAKCSEVSVFRLPDRVGHPARYRMVYEACDGTARDQRGVWRIASATSAGASH
jgi:predicted GH43/DUF377 family glycosyl hydrolase